MCGPSPGGATVRGLVQAAKAPPSTAHSKPAASASGESKLNVALRVGPPGPLRIWVSGAVVSTVNELDAGVASTLPAPSRARTENVWLPSPSVATVVGLVQAAYAAASSAHSHVAPG